MAEQIKMFYSLPIACLHPDWSRKNWRAQRVWQLRERSRYTRKILPRGLQPSPMTETSMPVSPSGRFGILFAISGTVCSIRILLFNPALQSCWLCLHVIAVSLSLILIRVKLMPWEVSRMKAHCNQMTIWPFFCDDVLLINCNAEQLYLVPDWVVFVLQ